MCGISPHKRKSNFSFCVAYLMVPEISFDCNFDMWSAFSWLFQNLETDPDWWASSSGGTYLASLLDQVTKSLLHRIPHKSNLINFKWLERIIWDNALAHKRLAARPGLFQR